MRTCQLALLAIILPLMPMMGPPDASAQPPIVVDSECDPDFPSCPPGTGIQGLRGAHAVVVSPDGKHVYVPTSLDDALVAFARAVNGTLTHVQTIFDIDAGIDGLDSARGIAMSPDGKHVYVAALLDKSLTAFGWDAGTGALTFIEVEIDGVGAVDGLAGANAVAVSPDGRHVYVASRSEDALAVFSRDAATGTVTFVEVHKDGLAGVDGLDAAESVTVSPDGKHVYVAGETDNAVVAFSRETDTGSADFGKLTFVEAEFDGLGDVDGLEGADGVTLSPDGLHVYVASQRGPGGGDWGAVFARDASTGALTFVQGFDESDFGTGTTGIFVGCFGVGPANSGVVVSPDGAFTYYTNAFRGTVTAFSRNATTGALTLASSTCDLNFFVDGIVGVSAAIAIATSPDGYSLYTASLATETVATLARHADLGDAPDPTFPTLFASTGAAHGLGTGVFLGSCVDADANGQPTAGGTGDDAATGSPVFGSCATTTATA